MLEAKVRENKEVVINAAKKLAWKKARAERVKYNRFKGAERPYDDRNISELALLLIDVDKFPPDKKEELFDAEVEKIIDAFEGKTDIKPYIQSLFDNTVISDDIDWSDQKQVEMLLATMKNTQDHATLFKNFKLQTFGIYSTHEQIEALDAKIGRAYTLYLNVGEALKKAGIAPTVDSHFQLGLHERASIVSNFTLTARDASTDVFDAMINGEKNVTIDPTKYENSKKFFLKQKIEETEWDGTEFTEDDYAREYINALCKTSEKTSIEQLMMSNLIDADEDLEFGYPNMLFINGKSFLQISQEMAEKHGYNRNNRAVGDMLAGKILRDALTDGKSVVSLLRMSYTTQGTVKFTHQDVKVDLDKLNEVDRQETKYSYFRRLLDRFGIFKIQKYPTNASRDAKQAKTREKTKHHNAMREAENKILELYSTIKPEPTKDKNLANIIPKLVRHEDVPENKIGEQIIENKVEREPILDINLKEENTLVSEPHKQSDEKVISREPGLK